MFLKEESEISIQKDFGHVTYMQIAEKVKKKRFIINDSQQKISHDKKAVILLWTLQQSVWVFVPPIDLNGGLLIYSFISMIISLSNLVSMCKIKKIPTFKQGQLG